ncbi:MAG: hypothetical protein HY980_04225 [Candidatus Magasanikbacteria bacterium]|nr:hypothetical protein [Candidatus Magasanikbacteria bacterium]
MRREIKARPDDQRAVVADGKCSICDAEVTSPGNFCAECGAVFVKEKGSTGGRETQFLASVSGRVETRPPGNSNPEVEPDPAGHYDVRGFNLPRKGLVRKKRE